MSLIPGKYEVTESRDFYELMIKVGSPEAHAKAVSEAKDPLEFQVDGNKIRILSVSNSKETVSDLVVDKEVDETFPGNTIAKSTTSVNGNVVTVNSVTPEGTVKRVYTFTAGGVEVLLKVTRADVTAEATRIYKRS